MSRFDASERMYRNFEIYGPPQEQDKYRKRAFRKYVEDVLQYKIVDDTKEWTKLQGLKGKLTVVQRNNLSRMQMVYSAKYNTRWEKARRKKQVKREKDALEATRKEAKASSKKKKAAMGKMEIDAGEKENPMDMV